MKRKIFSKLLMGAFLIASVSMFVSCKDYDDDISKVNSDVSALKTQLSTLETALNSAKQEAATAHATYATKTELADQVTAIKNSLASGDAANADAIKALEEQLAAAKQALADGDAANADAVRALEALLDAAKQAAVDGDNANAALIAANDVAIKANVAAIDALKADVAAAAKAEDLATVKNDLEKAIAAASEGKVTEEGLAETLKPISAKIDAIDESLNTLTGDVAALKEWKESVEGKVASVVADLEAQKKVLDDLKKAIDAKADVSGMTEAAVKEYVENVLKGYSTSAQVSAAISEALKSYKTSAELDNLLKGYSTPASVTETVKAYYTAMKVDEQIADAKNELNNAIVAVQTAAITETKVSQIANNAANSVSEKLGADIMTLNIFIKRQLSSINLSPAKFYGGIEGIDIFAFTPNQKVMNEKWHFFTEGGAVTLSEIGTADYHISPKTVDLSKGTVNFFTRTSDIIEPATTEMTRGGVTNTNRVSPVYANTDDLLAKNHYNASTGILTVPFKVDNATAIADELAKGKGTIASLQISQKDTTVTSDYALVVPTIAKHLLITDKSFASKNTGAVWNDIPGLENGDVNTYHLHRNFSYLAVSKTTATHTIVFDKSFNISNVLGIHAVDKSVDVKTVKTTKSNTIIVDTAKIITEPRATAVRYNYDKNYDSDATLLKTLCTDLDATKLAELGLYFDINPVGYSLGTTKTEESNHIEILKENGQFIAYPRNVNGTDGATIKGETANASAVGRMPIVCIELKYQKGAEQNPATDPTVTFAYMKFLIVQGDTPAPENKETDFEVSDVWADCGEVSGDVKWYQIEYKVYNDLLGISKETFDNRYLFDFYKDDTVADETDKTKFKENRYAYRFKKSGAKFSHDNDSIGQIVETWNMSEQKVEDATTHIIKWTFTTDDYMKVYKDLKARGKLKYDWDKGEMSNTEEIVTYVRYLQKNAKPAANQTKFVSVEDGEPCVYIKLTIPVGKFHFALGSLGGQKTLTYWYELNKRTNAPEAKTAKEVRVNVPVPVPNAKMSTSTLSALQCPWNEGLWITNDNLLERTEFLKDLHDYFRNGELSASVIDKTHFPLLSKTVITPEFKFTLPSKALGNVDKDKDFEAAADGTWKVKGISGTTYTLKLFNKDSQIRISPYTEGDILCSITDDNNNVQSVIKYHEGIKQDDILNYKSHNDLGQLETFTAYIMIDTPDACAPIEFDDMWFNVRFLRPLDLNDPQGGILPDAPNDWQYINIAKYASVIDWRDYLADPQNRIGGEDKTVAGFKVDYAYYQVGLNTDEQLFLTDAGLGTNQRDPSMVVGQMKNINTDEAYKALLWKTSEVNGLLVQKTDKEGGDQVPNSVQTTWIRYKNNSGVTGGFHIYVPIQMTYVFGNYPQVTQLKYVPLGITQSVAQDQ